MYGLQKYLQQFNLMSPYDILCTLSLVNNDSSKDLMHIGYTWIVICYVGELYPNNGHISLRSDSIAIYYSQTQFKYQPLIFRVNFNLVSSNHQPLNSTVNGFSSISIQQIWSDIQEQSATIIYDVLQEYIIILDIKVDNFQKKYIA